MEAQHYYINGAQQDDVCDERVPLRVNCVGYEKRHTPFVTNTTRRDWYLQLMDEGELTLDDGTRLTKGQFIVRPPDKPYRYELLAEETIGYYWIHFTGGFAEQLLAENGILPEKVYTVAGEHASAIERELQALFREFMLKRSAYGCMAAARLTALLVQLGRRIQACSVEAAGSNLRKRLERPIAYIHNHYAEPISVKALAAMENLSESRFREMFKSAFGVSAKGYIINLRIDRAGDLLCSTDLSVAQIAEACGYEDELYFSRIFKKRIGVSPYRYRQEHTRA